MTDANKKRLLTAGIIFAVIVIILLLLRKTGVAQGAGSNLPSDNMTFAAPVYTPSNFSVGGLPSDSLSLSIVYPQNNYKGACSCGGCDTSSPLNQAFGSLADFVNSYTASATAQQKSYAQAAYDAIPPYLRQYINGGGGLIAA
jgi:hypothetical protein